MNIRNIKTEHDCRTTLALASAWRDNESATSRAEGNPFGAWLTIINAYEAKHFPVNLSITKRRSYLAEQKLFSTPNRRHYLTLRTLQHD